MKKIILILIAVSLFSCVDPINRAVNTIDKGIAAINTQGADWQNIIKQISKDMPHEAHDIIGNDLEILSKDVIGATGSETKCSLDFVRLRAVQTLENLKAKLLKKPIKNTSPGFCTLNISSIDLNSDPISRSTLNIYGYDLNSLDLNRKRIKAALIGKNIKQLIDERYMGRTTNYQLTINLNSLIPDLVENKYDKIQLYWNGDTINMPQILIQKWNPKVKVIEFQPTPFTFVPPHTGGDPDFDTGGGNPAVGKISVEFRVNKKSIESRVFMDAMEFGGNNTRVGISLNDPNTPWSDWTTIFTLTDDNYEIRELSPNTPSTQIISIDSKGQKLFFMGGGSVSSYTVDLDQVGDEAGTYTKVTVSWNKLSAMVVEKKPTKQ